MGLYVARTRALDRRLKNYRTLLNNALYPTAIGLMFEELLNGKIRKDMWEGNIKMDPFEKEEYFQLSFFLGGRAVTKNKVRSRRFFMVFEQLESEEANTDPCPFEQLFDRIQFPMLSDSLNDELRDIDLSDRNVRWIVALRETELLTPTGGNAMYVDAIWRGQDLVLERKLGEKINEVLSSRTYEYSNMKLGISTGDSLLGEFFPGYSIMPNKDGGQMVVTPGGAVLDF